MILNKTILLGITGSIAAYKMADLVSRLSKDGCDVHVILTENAAKFISPKTFEILTGNECIIDTFQKSSQFKIPHIDIAQKSDVCMVAPADANILAKAACGIGDDMLSTILLACTCPKIFAPAMNVHMYENPIVQDNIKKLIKFGYTVIPPEEGVLACREVGKGKLPQLDVLYDYLERDCVKKKDMLGKKVLVTAGPTQEALDPVRYITNHSSGKMGYAIARRCAMRGADVTLVSGKTNLEKPRFIKTIEIISAQDMYEVVKENMIDKDFIFKAAAVADYTPVKTYSEKIKKNVMGDSASLPLKKTNDILKYLGEHKQKGQFICGFSMETENLEENSKVKLINKNVDMIAANSLRVKNAGFQCDTNQVTLITKNQTRHLKLLSKEDTADLIIDMALEVKNSL